MPAATQKIYTAQLINNCPLCFGTNGLEISFSEAHIENRFFFKPDKELSVDLFCHTCNQQIYPVSWTSDIERVYEYQQKLALLEKGKFKLKSFFFIILGAGILLLISLISFLLF